MEPPIPPSAQSILNEYRALLHAALPELLVSLYLHGSLALDAFDPRLSDIDFIAVTSRRCTPADCERLRVVHHILHQRHPQPPLSGSYLEWHDLGQAEATVLPHPFIHDGVFHDSGYHDINGVTWLVLKQHGIALLGPPPAQLAIEVDWRELLASMHHNLNTYWASFTTDPRRIAWLLDDYGIQWAVLGVLRQFYTFRERALTSKVGAGHYALGHTPPRWHRLIHEAISIREGGSSSYQSRIVRAAHAYAFLHLIITACNTQPDHI
jgi:hypothetical protein